MKTLVTRVETLERNNASANQDTVFLPERHMMPADLVASVAVHERAGREVVVIRRVIVSPGNQTEASHAGA